MPKVLFAKEILSNPILVNGASVKWQSLPGNHGYLELESPKDDVLIAALGDLAAKQVGGVYRISEVQLAQKKTQAALTPLSLPRGPKEMLRPMPKGPFERKPQGAKAAVAPVKASNDAQPITHSALARAAAINTPQPPAQISTIPATLNIPIGQPNVPIGEPVPVPVTEAFRPATRRVGRPRKIQEPVPA